MSKRNTNHLAARRVGQPVRTEALAWELCKAAADALFRAGITAPPSGYCVDVREAGHFGRGGLWAVYLSRHDDSELPHPASVEGRALRALLADVAEAAAAEAAQPAAVPPVTFAPAAE